MARLIGVVALLVLAACGGGDGRGSAPVDAAEAVRRVLAEDPRFAGIGPRDPSLIGQAAWYEVGQADDGWRVHIRIGWGDCPAGCINEHTWEYRVSADGDVMLVNEEGPEPPAEGGVSGVVVAGPTCPVLSDPPDPACADRPVEAATLLVVDAADRVVSRIVTDGDGRFVAALAPGVYRLVPQPVDGLLGIAAEVAVRVEDGAVPAELVIAYDTGIR